ncbi:hypothetical protein NQ315_008804 [Exocentrus adspersus]|uniref:Uncharacterized protein n=1 Tax=Exocentrus adspersus TaxID=1586481 RepID=A0AAV8VG94_9CUCU|nr:hypothetical protein NQ315_008804 [Exocentrus adspersus]
MDINTYEELLCLVTPLIKNNDTVMRPSITPHERLSATLRFLATGRTFEDMKFSVIISPQALSQIIPETFRAIITVLKDQYMKFPNTENDWKKISKEFQTVAIFQMPRCDRWETY